MMMTLDHALTIARETLAEGKRRGMAPLCCVVLDHGGHTLALLRDETGDLTQREVAGGILQAVGQDGHDDLRRAIGFRCRR